MRPLGVYEELLLLAKKDRTFSGPAPLLPRRIYIDIPNLFEIFRRLPESKGRC